MFHSRLLSRWAALFKGNYPKPPTRNPGPETRALPRSPPTSSEPRKRGSRNYSRTSTRNPKPQSFNPNLQPSPRNPKPETRNPGPVTYFTEVYSGSEAGSYLRLIDFVYHATLGLRVLKKKTWIPEAGPAQRHPLQRRAGFYRGTSLIRSTHPPRTTIVP